MKLSAGILLILVIFFIASTDESKTDTIANPVIYPYAVSPFIPKHVTFCGEEVPLQFFDIFESLERELIVNTYFHSQTLLYIKKSYRFFPEIELILKKNGIPDDFKYLAVAESGFTHIVSPAGATGFWQLMEGTAKENGLEVNDQVDERYNLTKATDVACRYIKSSYNYYKNWTMSAASYNAGRTGIERQVGRQGEKGYYDLLLFEETARYLFRIIAIKMIFENPALYGFAIPDSEKYKPIPYHEITINGSIDDIGSFAREKGTNYKLFKMLNPWLRDNKLTNTQKRSYVIRIPETRELN